MRIFPDMCPSTTWPFSSLTLKVALGRLSTISPCIWITSSLDIWWLLLLFASVQCLPSASGEPRPTLEIGLFQQAFVLVRHDVSLHLRHEIHGHDHDNQQRRASEIERHVVFQDQELGQQAHQGDVD